MGGRASPRRGAVRHSDDAAGRRLGAIDTRDHFSVRWEYFDEDRAVYYVTQDAETIFISTLDPNARDVLVVNVFPPAFGFI